MPLVGVGLLYQQGYFRQYLATDGWQQESYPVNDFYNMALEQVLDAQGQPLRIRVRLAGETADVLVWKVNVGRLPLYLLDTNVPENPRHLQDITDQLYGGNEETRIRQEIVLGIGGLRALAAMGLSPDVCHMNEGHSAFLSVERIRMLMREHGLIVRRGAAGRARRQRVHDAHAGARRVRRLPARPDGAVSLGRRRGAGHLAGRVARARAAARRHTAGRSTWPASRSARRRTSTASAVCTATCRAGMLREYIPAVPEAEVPVGYVTNGVHTRSCLSREMSQLFDRYLGMDWWRDPGQSDSWARVDAIPDEEIWATHARRRERLVAFARRRLVQQISRRGATARDIEHARGVVVDAGADHRIRAAVRHLQTCRAGAAGSSIASAASCATSIGRCSSSSPARPIPKDHEGKEVPQARRAVLHARRAIPRARGLHRRLRHHRGAVPAAGRRRVAQHAAPPDGSQRHQRHEGAAERRAEPQHPRRLVVRRVRAGNGLGDRPRRRLSGLRVPGRRRVERALRHCSKRKSCRSSTRAGRTACPARGSSG